MPYSREKFSPTDGTRNKDRPYNPVNEHALGYLRGTIEREGDMTLEAIARLLGLAEPAGRGTRKAQEYLDALNEL